MVCIVKLCVCVSVCGSLCVRECVCVSVCVSNLPIRTTHIGPINSHTSVRLANLKRLVQCHVCYPDVVFSVHRNAMRHVEEVAAPVADNGASSGVQRQHCGDSNRAFGCVLEVVAGIETAVRQLKYWHCALWKRHRPTNFMGRCSHAHNRK